MIITKDQVLAAMAALGVAMTVTSTTAWADEERAELAATQMQRERSTGVGATGLEPRPVGDYGIERGTVQAGGAEAAERIEIGDYGMGRGTVRAGGAEAAERIEIGHYGMGRGTVRAGGAEAAERIEIGHYGIERRDGVSFQLPILRYCAITGRELGNPYRVLLPVNPLCPR